VAGKLHIYPEMAAAGLWTTPTDLAKFGIEMQLSLAGKSNKVLSKESAEMMTKAFVDEAGLGFFVEKHGNAVYFGHGGADEGFRAELLVNRDKGYGIAVMTNSDSGQILREVVRGVAREYGWEEFIPAPYEIIALDASKLTDYAGRYQINAGRVVNIKVEDGKLIAYPTGERKFEMLPISETTFVRRDAPMKFNFVRQTTGSAGPVKSDGAPAVATSIQVLGPGNNSGEAKRLGDDTFVPFEYLLAGKLEEAMEGYRQLKKETPDNPVVSEQRLNTLGYGFMRQKKMPEAIAVFKVNVELYPNSWNTYDSLGEAYMNNGDKELAMENYKKSLALNSNNTGGAAALKKLEAEKQ
jgi:tetratricopeptide (TPR) repeat protein